MSGPDIAAVIETIRETSTEVQWLKRAVQALLDHNGIGLDGPKSNATDGETNGMQFGRVLVVTADLRLRDRLVALAQGLGLDVNVAVHPEVAGRHYQMAPLVLAGADQATACLRAGLPVWGDVVIVMVGDGSRPAGAWELPDKDSLSRAVKLVALPGDEWWVICRLREELVIG